jgi:hypothetical protein
MAENAARRRPQRPRRTLEHPRHARAEELLRAAEVLSGASLEKLLRPLWDKMAGAPVQANGLNLQGAPISGTLDALWPAGPRGRAMIVDQIWTANAFRNFNYLIVCKEPGEALAVDPLDHAKCLATAKAKGWTITQIRALREGERISSLVADRRLTPCKVLLGRRRPSRATSRPSMASQVFRHKARRWHGYELLAGSPSRR